MWGIQPERHTTIRDQSTPKCPLARRQGGHRMGWPTWWPSWRSGPVASRTRPLVVQSTASFRYAVHVCQQWSLYTFSFKNYTWRHNTSDFAYSVLFGMLWLYHYHDRRASCNTPIQWCSQAGALEAINYYPPPPPFQAANFFAICSM